MRTIIAKSFMALALFNLCAASAMAQKLNAKHPGYLKALADLRVARYYLNKQAGEPKLREEEETSIKEIDAAIAEIQKASIDDGKSVTDVPVDANEHGSPLAKAIETIYKAQNDVGHEEENPEVKGLRHEALEHISHAADAAKEAHLEWLNEMKEGKK